MYHQICLVINTGVFCSSSPAKQGNKEINCIFTEFQPTTSAWGIVSLHATKVLLLVKAYQPEGIKLDFSDPRLESCWAEIKKYLSSCNLNAWQTDEAALKHQMYILTLENKIML